MVDFKIAMLLDGRGKMPKIPECPFQSLINLSIPQLFVAYPAHKMITTTTIGCFMISISAYIVALFRR